MVNLSFESAVRAFGENLDKITRFELSKEEQFITLCAHIKTQEFYVFYKPLITIDPGSASKVLMYAEEIMIRNISWRGLFFTTQYCL